MEYLVLSRTTINCGARCFFCLGQKKHSIPAKAGISSRVSGNFREAEWLPVSECGCRRRDSRLRGNEGRRDGEIKRTSIPAKAGISAAKPHSPKATIAMFRFAENSRCRENEIPAFAGMEDSFFCRSFLLFSIPSPFPFPRRRESLPASAGNSAKRNGRLSANAAVAAEIPAFAGMEGGQEWKGGAGMERGSGIENGSGMEVRVGGNERRAGMEAGAGIAFIIR